MRKSLKMVKKLLFYLILAKKEKSLTIHTLYTVLLTDIYILVKIALF